MVQERERDLSFSVCHLAHSEFSAMHMNYLFKIKVTIVLKVGLSLNE